MQRIKDEPLMAPKVILRKIISTKSKFAYKHQSCELLISVYSSIAEISVEISEPIMNLSALLQNFFIFQLISYQSLDTLSISLKAISMKKKESTLA